MKIRNDFISNSSSCSFFIHLDTQEALDKFKTLVPELKGEDFLANGYYESLDDLRSNECYANMIENSPDSNWTDDLKPGCVIACGTIDDGWPSIQLYDSMVELLEKTYDFQFYQDDMAHITIGKKVKKKKGHY